MVYKVDVKYTYSVIPRSGSLARRHVTDDVYAVRSPVRTPGGTKNNNDLLDPLVEGRRGIAPTR